MSPRLKAAVCCLVASLLLFSVLVPAQERNAAAARQAWTLDEALAALALQPRDAYLQYVALQLARRTGRFGEVETRVRGLVADDFDSRAERRRDADLFGLFTGALAVQESLQLDSMRSVAPQPAPAADEALLSPEARRREGPRVTLQGRQQPRTQGPVPVSTLAGPTTKSHPWEKMLAGRRPDISALARAVPEDFYFAEFRALSKLLDAFDAGDLWGSHLSNQAFRDALTLDVGERLKRQLAVETDARTRPFYDLVVDEVAVAGSDPFVREGSDVTLLFRVKQPLLFRGRMDGFIDDAAKSRPDARRETGQYLGVEYTQLQTPERDLSVVSAYPEEGLHVRSNSLAAFKRIVEAIKGRDA
jgi:hypothetical protein